MSAREDFERWGGAAAFGTAHELTPMQTLMWRAERHRGPYSEPIIERRTGG